MIKQSFLLKTSKRLNTLKLRACCVNEKLRQNDTCGKIFNNSIPLKGIPVLQNKYKTKFKEQGNSSLLKQGEAFSLELCYNLFSFLISLKNCVHETFKPV